jgi:hypothetical protein
MAAPAEAEGRGSWADMAALLSIINESASNIYMLWESIYKTKKLPRNIIYFVWEAGRLEDYQKGVLGVCFRKRLKVFVGCKDRPN